jgi:hypothetical protein
MEKLSGRYLSSSASYLPAFRERVREVTRGAAFWG